MERKKSVIIDFAGSSCSGKTHVKNELMKHLCTDHRCIDFSECRMTCGDCFGFIFGSPATCVASMMLVLSGVPRGYGTAFKLLKKWFTVQIKTRKASRMEADFVFLDEGFFKWLGNIGNKCFRKISFERLHPLVRKNLFYPDITIFVDADFDTVQRRKILRGIIPHSRNGRLISSFLKHRDERLKSLLFGRKVRDHEGSAIRQQCGI